METVKYLALSCFPFFSGKVCCQRKLVCAEDSRRIRSGSDFYNKMVKLVFHNHSIQSNLPTVEDNITMQAFLVITFPAGEL